MEELVLIQSEGSKTKEEIEIDFQNTNSADGVHRATIATMARDGFYPTDFTAEELGRIIEALTEAKRVIEDREFVDHPIHKARLIHEQASGCTFTWFRVGEDTWMGTDGETIKHSTVTLGINQGKTIDIVKMGWDEDE